MRLWRGDAGAAERRDLRVIHCLYSWFPLSQDESRTGLVPPGRWKWEAPLHQTPPSPRSLSVRRNPQIQNMQILRTLCGGREEGLSDQEDAIFGTSAGLHFRLFMEVHIDDKIQRIYIAEKVWRTCLGENKGAPRR